MSALSTEILQVFRGTARYRLPAVAVAWLFSVIGFLGVVVLVPDRFRAEALISIESGPTPVDAMFKAGSDRIVTETNAIDAVAQALRSSGNPAPGAVGEGALIARQANPNINWERVRDSVELLPGPLAGTVVLRYHDSDPEIARKILQFVLTALVRLGSTNAEPSSASNDAEQGRPASTGVLGRGNIVIQLLEDARSSFVPIGPNRMLLAVATAVSSLAAGAFTALFLSLLRPVYDAPEALRDGTGLTVLGGVSLIRTVALKKAGWVRCLAFWMATGSLVLAWIGALMVNFNGLRLPRVI